MIKYTDSIKNITADMLIDFFEGWPNPPSKEVHLKILKNSDYFVLAIDNETGNVVGFITAVSDNVLCAYIPYIEVITEYQNKGIGTQLLKKMLKKLEHLYMVDLVCDGHLKTFYSKFKMYPHTAMILRKYDKQCGE